MRLFFLLTAVIMFGFNAKTAHAHCQVPCGIFGDARVFDELEEHITTIEKAASEIKKMQGETPLNIHTITRWTATKEDHAQKIQDIMAEYFLAQRVKLLPKDADTTAQERYNAHLVHIHKITVAAMKSKQSLDNTHTSNLKKLIGAFENLYFKPDNHSHD